MFKSARWRIDNKNRITAVFKLQFYVTQVSQLGVDALMISLVPGDVGKPTVRSEKAIVQDGSCRWKNPVYETVKFVHEAKTGKISERVYQFIVSTGFSKADLVGEVSFDFANYAETTKASTMSLPLTNSNTNAILHVWIRRLLENVDQREMEESENAKAKSRDRSLKAHLRNADTDESIIRNSVEVKDGPFHKTTHNAKSNGNRRVSSGSDITISCSETSSGLNTPRELALRNNEIQHDSTNLIPFLSLALIPHKPTENTSAIIYEEGNQRSQWEWSVGSDYGVLTSDSTNSSQDILPREHSQQASDLEIEKLKDELVIMARQLDVSDLELQTLRKQIIKESKRGQDLTREAVSLKEERDSLKAECEKFKIFQKRMDEARVKDKLQFEEGDVLPLLEEVRNELNYERDLNGNLRLQLQKTQEANAELILAIQDLDEMLEEKNKTISNLSNKLGSSEKVEELRLTISKCEADDDDEEQKALEEIVKDHREAEETHLLEQKMIDLYGEIEIYQRDRDELEMQMEQLALDYEILKQENHDISYKLEQSQVQEQLKMQYECSSSFDNINELETHIERLENELRKQSKELSDSLATITELEIHIRSLEEELEKQEQGFEADLEDLTCAKVKQEQRAIRAEETLRKTRWINANTAERLQEEFRRLYMQMACTLNADEKVSRKAKAEASELRMQKSQLEGLLQKAKEELRSMRDDLEAKNEYFSNQIDLKTYQIEQILLELEKKSKQLDHQTKHNEDVNMTFFREISMLKAEVTRLTAENNFLTEKAEVTDNLRAEVEQLRESAKVTGTWVPRGNAETNELVSTMALVKKEAEMSLDELNCLRLLNDENDTTIRILQSELEMLKAQCEESNDSLPKDELEKEQIREQIELKETALEISTENDVQDKAEEVKFSVELILNKRLSKNTFQKVANENGDIDSNTPEVNSTNLSKTACIPEENGDAMPLIKSDDKILTEETKPSVIYNEDGNPDDLLTELTAVKEKNESMENELKEMQSRYSEISLKFAEVEGERQRLVMTVRSLKNFKKSMRNHR